MVAPDLRHIAPEGGSGEFLPHDHRAAAQQRRARRHHAAHAVIHGQAVVEPVAGASARHAGEPVGPAHHPAVADMGRLGQSGCAGGVDQQGAVIQRDLAPFRFGQRCAGKTFQQPAEIRTMAPDFRAASDRDRARPLGGDDVLGRRLLDAMGKRFALQVGVDQRHNPADAGDAEPDRQIIRPVGHQQADRIAFLDALGQRPAGNPVGARREPGMAQAFAGADQRRRVTETRAQFFNHDGKCVGCLRLRCAP